MIYTAFFDGSFAGWRNEARRLVLAGMEPQQIAWEVGEVSATLDMFCAADAQPGRSMTATIPIPRQLFELLQIAACFRGDNRWGLLYRILWRVCRGERSAMLAGDPDGSQLHRRIKAVRREIHHTHAFLRFRSLPESPESPCFIAWHEPAHDILHLAVEHFAARMGKTHWLIVTPEGAAHWNGEKMSLTLPCPPALTELARAAAEEDDGLWVAYYKSTFNPARLNKECLERSLPVRFWKNLPEGSAIPELMSQARCGGQSHGQFAGVTHMPGHVIGTKSSEKRCQSCPRRTGQQPAISAEQCGLVLLADQPGARPFGGAAGRLMDQALRDVGLDRSQVYLTYAVKHFNPLVEIKARARQQLLKPSREEIAHCRPCLQTELSHLQPKAILALGQTATQALLGDNSEFDKLYGHLVEDEAGRKVLIGDHPSELLWNHPTGRQWAYDALLLSLRQAKRLCGIGT
ncbi:TIGR03915 family putative DNA repair protein [Pseudomonas sp. BMS12]|uniref:TIGR03915 family putative DNA repair protein n=1 Tax=Pseudomonas sp. BMS12 TaxID=1796033 RepID=UPI0013725821|nr:TIGR03915 family putative DNA repair protein [Pseudomonas sp. BMS12]